MQNLNLYLGVIQNVNIENKTIDIIDISKSNLSTVDYRDVYLADISEQQIIPQKGYMVLFAVIGSASTPGMKSIAFPIKYFSSQLNGENSGSTKSRFASVLQEEGDQLQSSSKGTAIGILGGSVVIQSGAQKILLDKENSQTIINYDSLTINGQDGLKITQTQGSDELTIIKGGTKITINDDKVNIEAGTVTIGGEATVKGESIVKWLNNHTHSNGNNGSPTGAPMMELDEDILVKE